MPPRKKSAASSSTSATSTSTTNKNNAPASRTYRSAPVPKQVYFPPRRKMVRTYGRKGRRSLPAELEGGGIGIADDEGKEENGPMTRRRSLRQATLTQVGYVRSSSGLGEEDEGRGELRVSDEEDNMEEVMEEAETGKSGAPRGKGSGSTKMGKKGVRFAEGKEEKKARTRRRRTTGDLPSWSESKASTFHTQTLTQLLSTMPDSSRDTLRLDDDDDNDPDRPKNRRKRRSPQPPLATSSHTPGTTDPHTPSAKRIRVSLDEVPCSQPTPLTPMLDRYSPLVPGAVRSPLTQKSTNVGVAIPESVAQGRGKRPRTLVVQDSYASMLSESEPEAEGPVGPGASGKHEEKKEESQRIPLAEIPLERLDEIRGKGKASQRVPLSEIPVESLECVGVARRSQSQRVPLAEIPVESLAPAAAGQGTQSQRVPLAEIPVESLAAGGAEDGMTPTTRRVLGSAGRGRYVEIPDSDDDGLSLGSTPFSRTQRTPLAPNIGQGFEVLADSGSSRSGRNDPQPPGSVRSMRSDKENSGPLEEMRAPREIHDSEDESDDEIPGTPTPASRRAMRLSQGAGSRSVIKASSELGSRSPKLATSQRMQSNEPVPETPTPAARMATPVVEERVSEEDDEEATASESEEKEQGTPVRAVKKPTPQVLTSTRKSALKAPGTPTPAVRRVQIELPPTSASRHGNNNNNNNNNNNVAKEEAEEAYKETPRRPQAQQTVKSSPLYARQTQRSQYFSQLESQRVPLEVIRSLGPQTDRSDILIAIPDKIVDEIVQGLRDHEFRPYRFPTQVCRVWIYTVPNGREDEGEVKYMATLGPAKEPGEIDSRTGLGNAEFNMRKSPEMRFAHKLKQVYRLNNPLPAKDMPDNGLGRGAPLRWRYVPPAIVGQLLGNLRCPLFEEEDENAIRVEDDDRDVAGGTVSQQLEEQLLSDLVGSTKRGDKSKEREIEREEEDVIPASQSPLAPRASRKGRGHRGQQDQQPKVGTGRARPSIQTSSSNFVRPSQATTASEASEDPSLSSPPPAAARMLPPPRNARTRANANRPRQVHVLSSETNEPSPRKDNGQDPTVDDEEEPTPTPFPRPQHPLSSSQPALSLPAYHDGSGENEGGSLGVELPLVESSSLPPDSLLIDRGREAPEPILWDSDEEEL